MGGIYGGSENSVGIVVIDLTAAAPGSSDWIDLPLQSPLNIGFGCEPAAAVDYTVEHRFGPGGDAFPHPFVQNVTTNQDGNYAFPVYQIRLTLNAAGQCVARFLIPGAQNFTLTQSI